jgi:hypothetical protein
MKKGTERCAQIIYEVWKESTINLLEDLEYSIEGAVAGKVPNPRRLEIYFTPLITKKSYRWSKDDFGVKESIEAVMKLYLEGNSPVWNSWEEYEEAYRERRVWGNFRGENIHTHFIPDTMLVEMLNRLQAETQYSRGKFTEFAELYSLDKNYSLDEDEKDLQKVFNEVVIHEISHHVLNQFCQKNGHSYPSAIGEAVGWFLDHKIYDNTYHSYAERNVEDLDVGIFSSYSFSEEEKKYVSWLIDAMNFSYEVDRKNGRTQHPYPWTVVFISLITSKDELSKKKIFTELLPRKTQDTIDKLEEIIETEYREEYKDLIETVESTEQKIKELEEKATRGEGEKKELYEKKKFHEEMERLKHRLKAEIDLETPQEFEEYVEGQIQGSANQEHRFEETVEHMEENITQHVEEQKNTIETSVKLCVEKEQEMSDQEIGEINGEKIPERKQFLDRIQELNSIMEKLALHLDKVEHRFYIYQRNN